MAAAVYSADCSAQLLSRISQRHPQRCQWPSLEARVLIHGLAWTSPIAFARIAPSVPFVSTGILANYSPSPRIAFAFLDLAGGGAAGGAAEVHRDARGAGAMQCACKGLWADASSSRIHVCSHGLRPQLSESAGTRHSATVAEDSPMEPSRSLVAGQGLTRPQQQRVSARSS